MLSEAVQDYPCLFDKSEKEYKDWDVVRNAWESKLDFVENGQCILVSVIFI